MTLADGIYEGPDASFGYAEALAEVTRELAMTPEQRHRERQLMYARWSRPYFAYGESVTREAA